MQTDYTERRNFVYTTVKNMHLLTSKLQMFQVFLNFVTGESL